MNTLVGEEAVKVRDVPFTYGPQYDLTYRKKKKKSHNLEDVMPTGVDDGKGARRLLNVYVDETLTRVAPHSQASVNFDILSDDFRNKPFLDQLNHVQMRGIPLLSQVARQDALWPYNSSKKKKHYIAFAKRMQRNDTGLIHARLSSEAIDDGIIKILEYALQKNTVLQHLALHKNAITDKGIEMLCLAIRWHPTLHTLWLGANPFCDIGARHISLLLGRNKNIKELNISNRWPSEIWQKNMYELHPHVTYVGAQYIAKQLMKGSGLTSLSLAEQRVRDDGAIYLFQALKHCRLRVLNLRENELSDRCCVELRASLELNPVLQELILSHNLITNDGAINIAYGLARNTVIHVLDLGYNLIDKAGLDGLFLCLKYNQSLTALITVRNKDPDRRAEELVYNRVHSVFNFTSATNHTPGSALNARGFFGAGHSAVNHNSAGRAATPPRIKRLPSPSGGITLSMDLNMPAGVEILGKSVHSRSFRSVHIDSKEASRSNSTRSASFRALSQQLDTEAEGEDHKDSAGIDGGVGATIDEDRPTTPAAPMLGSRKVNTAAATVPGTVTSPAGKSDAIGARVGTPPAPMLGSNKVRPPLHQQQDKPSTPSVLSPGEGLARTENAASSAPGRESPGGTPKLRADRKSKSVSLMVPDQLHNAEVLIPSPERKPNESPSKIEISRDRAHVEKSKESQNSAETAVSSTPAPAPAPKLLRKNSSKKFHSSFRRNIDSDQDNELSDALTRPPPAMFDLGRPVRSRDVGKTISIPNVKNMGIRPIRTSISPLKDSAQHLMYLRISTPFDGPDERPYSILNVGRDHLDEVKRVRKQRQDPKYKYDKAFKINNTPKQIRHQAALAKVPQSFWKDWGHKTRLQYIEGIDNAPGVTSTKLDVVTPRELTSAESSHLLELDHPPPSNVGKLTRSGTTHTRLPVLPGAINVTTGANVKAHTVSTPTAAGGVNKSSTPKSRDGPLRRSLLSADLPVTAPEKSAKTSMKRVGGSDFADNRSNSVKFAADEEEDGDTFGFSSKGGGFGSGSVKVSSSAKFGSSFSRMGSASSKQTLDPALDPTSPYYIYANDPSQSYRKHLTFKNNGVTPGKILAARRKENALKRQQKIDEKAEEERVLAQMQSNSAKSGFVIANASTKG